MPVDPNELLSRAQKNDAAGIQNLVSKGLNPRYLERFSRHEGCCCAKRRENVCQKFVFMIVDHEGFVL
jgi:hypothetical protein